MAAGPEKSVGMDGDCYFISGELGGLFGEICCPFMTVSDNGTEYLNDEYLKKVEEFKREGKDKLRIQLVGGGQSGAQTIVPRNGFVCSNS